MKDKIFCPSCGHIYDASEFITVYGNETKYICGTCHSDIKIEICDIRYTYYDILLKCSDDDFTVKTFNKKDSVQLLVAFNEFPNWRAIEVVENTLSVNEFNILVIQSKQNIFKKVSKDFEYIKDKERKFIRSILDTE